MWSPVFVSVTTKYTNCEYAWSYCLSFFCICLNLFTTDKAKTSHFLYKRCFQALSSSITYTVVPAEHVVINLRSNAINSGPQLAATTWARKHKIEAKPCERNASATTTWCLLQAECAHGYKNARADLKDRAFWKYPEVHVYCSAYNFRVFLSPFMERSFFNR